MNKTEFFKKATPAEVDIPASSVLEYIKVLEDKGFCLHSVMLVKDGKQVLDAYWAPFGPDTTHRLHSASKSIVALAVGIMAEEGRFSLDDPIAVHFEDKLLEKPHPYILKATIRDLLKMASVYDNRTDSMDEKDWVGSHLRGMPSHLPGKVFKYDGSATTTLAGLVERLSGMSLLDYLRPRLLDPIGVSYSIKCIQTPEGHSAGGGGIICTPMDLARMAYVTMHGGEHEGVQLIPREFIRLMTTKQIDTSITQQGVSATGYGYQTRIMPHDGFAFSGANGEIALCLPKHDTMLVVTADGCDKGDLDCETIIQTFYDTIYPALVVKQPLGGEEELYEYCKDLKLRVIKGAYDSPLAAVVSGMKFIMESNKLGLKRVQVVLNGDSGVFLYENTTGVHELHFGLGHNVINRFPETNCPGDRFGVPRTEGYLCASSGAWLDDNALAICVELTDDYLGMIYVQLVFVEGDVTLLMQNLTFRALEGYDGFASGYVEKKHE